MKPHEILKLGVLLLGLVFLYQGLAILPASVVQLFVFVVGLNIESTLTTLLQAGWPLLLAYWLLRGAPLLMRIAYPVPDSTSKQDVDVTGAHGREAI
ncbi:hypothetical protein SDC9_169572 [bioreactor metagenome]|uniref:Uncharacterized protein n=1 Tax=bioreactor metagenome TaxID=1076179 RepID=A0A645G8S5_9ZZZZ